jgi:hypothetical protein
MSEAMEMWAHALKFPGKLPEPGAGYIFEKTPEGFRLMEMDAFHARIGRETKESLRRLAESLKRLDRNEDRTVGALRELAAALREGRQKRAG